MYASYTSLLVGVNYKKAGHLAFWRTKSSPTSDEERYPLLRKVGDVHNLGNFNELCSVRKNVIHFKLEIIMFFISEADAL